MQYCCPFCPCPWSRWISFATFCSVIHDGRHQLGGRQWERERTLSPQFTLIQHPVYAWSVLWMKHLTLSGRARPWNVSHWRHSMINKDFDDSYALSSSLEMKCSRVNLPFALSFPFSTGFYMSELLYMFGELDPRVRPLTFSIRRWAQSCGLTNPSPGRWISNFSLSCLVMYFLQQLRQPILPAIGALVKAASATDIRVTEDGINCTFARDLDRLGFCSRNTSSLSELLLQFFEFYSQFDFHNRAISLNEGRAMAKPDHSAMYIVNPLEQLLNVSKNVSLEECERLRIEVRNAAWILESEVENTTLTEIERLEQSWGLLNLFKHPEKAVIRPNMFFKPRMVEVSDLFEKSQATTTTTTPAVNYKSASVRNQVQTIKATARSDLKQLRESSTATGSTTTQTGSSSSSGKSKRSRWWWTVAF